MHSLLSCSQANRTVLPGRFSADVARGRLTEDASPLPFVPRCTPEQILYQTLRISFTDPVARSIGTLIAGAFCEAANRAIHQSCLHAKCAHLLRLVPISPSGLVMLITCLQHSDLESPGCLVEWSRQRGHSLRMIRLHRGEYLPDAANLSDWLAVLGGPMGVYDESQYPWLKEEKAYIRLSILGGRTVFGICLGAQLIAHVLGAHVSQNPHAELGWMPITTTLEARGRFPLLPASLYALCWHNDTFDIPPQGTALGSSEACRNQGFFVGDRVLGLQFHLEWSPQDIKRLVDNSADEFSARGKYIQRPSDILAGVEWAQRANTLMVGLLDALPA